MTKWNIINNSFLWLENVSARGPQMRGGRSICYSCLAFNDNIAIIKKDSYNFTLNLPMKVASGLESVKIEGQQLKRQWLLPFSSVTNSIRPRSANLIRSRDDVGRSDVSWVIFDGPIIAGTSYLWSKNREPRDHCRNVSLNFFKALDK